MREETNFLNCVIVTNLRLLACEKSQIQTLWHVSAQKKKTFTMKNQQNLCFFLLTVFILRNTIIRSLSLSVPCLCAAYCQLSNDTHSHGSVMTMSSHLQGVFHSGDCSMLLYNSQEIQGLFSQKDIHFLSRCSSLTWTTMMPPHTTEQTQQWLQVQNFFWLFFCFTNEI